MGKHILDRTRRRKAATEMNAFLRLDRRYLPEDKGPVTRSLLRRAKGPLNDALRAHAFMKIERGYTA